MKLFLTRNTFKEGLIYIWTTESKDNLYLDDGVWESDVQDDCRAAVIHWGSFKAIAGVELPEPGSIQELSKIDFKFKENEK